MKASRQLRNIFPLTLWIVMVSMAVEAKGTGTAAPPVVGQSSQQPQIEKGRVAVTQVCVGCHVGIMRMLEVRKKSTEEWRDTVYRMIGRGAQVLPDEIEPLTAYLAASAGRGRQPQERNQGPVGAEIVARRCVQCHDLERATTKPASGDWHTTIDRMVTLGASLTPAEQQTLIEYLTGLEK
jgi:mono/diheme cytochrome c family protein